jgi:sulfur relay protein TusB/DsrH
MLYILGNGCRRDALELFGKDDRAMAVLLQDGVCLKCDSLEGREVYALKEDVESRGMEELLPGWIRRISYDELVPLIEANPVISFA